MDSLGNLAGEYAREIQRSPFSRPFDPEAFRPMPLASFASPLAGMGYGFGWYPSRLLRDESLRKPPDRSVQIVHGLMDGAVDPKKQPKIEENYRTALAQQFRVELDRHPAYKRLCAIAGFRSVLEAFAAAPGRKRKLDSPLRKHQAEAQLIFCIVRPLWRLSAKDWRPAPTVNTTKKARKAALMLIAAGKDGLHSPSSYWRTVDALRALLGELDAPTDRERVPKLDKHTARRATFEYFEELLASSFGAESFRGDLKGVRQAYAAMLGFQNPSDKVSP